MPKCGRDSLIRNSSLTDADNGLLNTTSTTNGVQYPHLVPGHAISLVRYIRRTYSFVLVFFVFLTTLDASCSSACSHPLTTVPLFDSSLVHGLHCTPLCISIHRILIS